MTCANCGKMIIKNAKYCTCCGAKVESREVNERGFFRTAKNNDGEETNTKKDPKGRHRIGLLPKALIAFLLFCLIIGGGESEWAGGSVSRDSIADLVTDACSKSGNQVDDIDVVFRKSFPYKNDTTLEVYEVTVDVLGEGKGKMLFSFIVGKNTVKNEAYYPASLLTEIFTGGVIPDFETESFSDEDIEAFAAGGHSFHPDYQ